MNWRFAAVILALSTLSIYAAKNDDYDADYKDIADDVWKDIGNVSDVPKDDKAPLNTTDVSDNDNLVEYAHCINDSGAEGKCVEYNQCKENIANITDGQPLIDIRASFTDCAYSEVCCATVDVRIIVKQVVKDVKAVGGCGVRNPKGIGFTITGATRGESNFGEFPWMVLIFREIKVGVTSKRLKSYAGGGSLIHPRVVLTGAHVAIKAGRAGGTLRARAGEWDAQSKREPRPYQEADVSEVITHESYTESLYNDVALLFLADAIDLQAHIGVICLPPLAAQASSASRCYASGWGQEIFDKSARNKVILKKIELPIVESSECEKALRRTRLGPFYVLHSSFVCAGGEMGKDTCTGDGGSPLACPLPGDPTRFMQSGIVAWGIGCGKDNVPGVYANVAFLRGWIDSKLASKHIDMTPYAINVEV